MMLRIQCEGCCSCEGLDQDIPADSCNVRGECCSTPSPSAAPSAAPTYLCLDRNQEPVTAVDHTLNGIDGTSTAREFFDDLGFRVDFSIVFRPTNEASFRSTQGDFCEPRGNDFRSKIIEVDEVDVREYLQMDFRCGDYTCGQSFIIQIKTGCGASDPDGSCQVIDLEFLQRSGYCQLTVKGCDEDGTVYACADDQTYEATDNIPISFPVTSSSAYFVSVF